MQAFASTFYLSHLPRTVLSHAKDFFRICSPKLHEFERQIKVEDVRAIGYLLRHVPLFFLGHRT